ncbi:hypothetical protein BDN72DRAFT_844601 [Pluteus cervinus]|uniref:Uncharacterized protein n=1 Tax=Pluteus cervinus TaxID=181527 RepID=A0ACD3AKP7_9AGAR|nr:hypothetical protein BDN72DRAFT_844601 [Pluteus cervinus]
MQTKFIIAFVLSCTAALVASSPVPFPTPAPAVNEAAFAKRQDDPTTTTTTTQFGGGGGGDQPDTCRYGCI